MKKKETSLIVPETEVHELESRLKSLSSKKVPAIKTRADYEGAEAIVKDIKSYLESVDDVFGEPRAAAKATVKAIDKQYKRFADPAKSLDTSIRDAMSVYLTAETRKAEEAAERARAKELAKASSKEERAEIASAPLEVKRVTGEDVSSRKNFYAVVVDAKKIPAEYFIGGVSCNCAEHVDTKKLDAMARTMKELFNIPGAEAKWTSSVVVNS